MKITYLDVQPVRTINGEDHSRVLGYVRYVNGEGEQEQPLTKSLADELFQYPCNQRHFNYLSKIYVLLPD